MAVPNNSTVRWFHSDMAGAPQATDQAVDLLAILDACLIDGFGTLAPDGNKITVAGGIATVEFSGGHDFEEYAVIEIEGATPAALNDVWRITGATATTFTFDCPGIPDGSATGSITVKRATPGYWEKPFEDANRRAFRSTHPDATGCFLYVDANDTSNTVYTWLNVRGYEEMTNLDTGIVAFPDPADRVTWTWTFRYSSYPPKWALFADEKTIYVYNKFRGDVAGGVLRCFGDFKPLVGEIYNCMITASTRAGESEPGQSEEFKLGSFTGGYAPRDYVGIAGNNVLSRGAPMNVRYIFGEADHPAISGGYIFSGPLTLSDPSAGLGKFQPRGLEPALYACSSGYLGLMGQPNTKIGDGFKVLSRAEAIGRAIAIIRPGSGDRDYESGCLGVDIEGPWS